MIICKDGLFDFIVLNLKAATQIDLILTEILSRQFSDISNQSKLSDAQNHTKYLLKHSCFHVGGSLFLDEQNVDHSCKDSPSEMSTIAQ